MALRSFRGHVDPSKLNTADLADAIEALSILDRLARKGVIEFEMRAGRRLSPPEVWSPSPQQQDILFALRNGPLTFAAVQAATGQALGSFGTNINSLVNLGQITRTRPVRPPGYQGRQPRAEFIYQIQETRDW